MKYNPDKGPPARKWLELDEGERIELVRQYHRRAKIKVPRATVHAALHATVETQLAMEIPAVQSALARLRGEGLDRHDAIHAIAQELAWQMNLALKSEESVDLNEKYERALDQLTAEKWLAGEDD
jgi:hypothetical protein